MACTLTGTEPSDDGIDPWDKLDSWVELTDRMAEALRELRRHVPNHAWWDCGAAASLLEYQACRQPPSTQIHRLRMLRPSRNLDSSGDVAPPRR